MALTDIAGVLYGDIDTTPTVDLLQKSHTAPPGLYPTMRHVVTEMCTCVHISATIWRIVGYLSDALWDLWEGTIVDLRGACFLDLEMFEFFLTFDDSQIVLDQTINMK